MGLRQFPGELWASCKENVEVSCASLWPPDMKWACTAGNGDVSRSPLKSVAGALFVVFVEQRRASDQPRPRTVPVRLNGSLQSINLGTTRDGP